MDTYAIICIFSLVIQCIWHAIIGAIIFLTTPNNQLTPSMWYTYLDRYVFIALLGTFIVVHIVLITWLYLVPFKYRKYMARKDIEYELSMSRMKSDQNRKIVRKNGRKSLSFTRVQI